MKYLVNTMSTADKRSAGSTNLGYELVLDKTKATRVLWTEEVPISRSDKIGFNIGYPFNIFNAFYFMRNHSLSFDQVLFGGPGVTNLNGLLDDSGIEIFKGEYEGELIDKKGWHRVANLLSPPYTNSKGNRVQIELTRGCKYKCAFCEYSWVLGGKYREKDFELVKYQLQECINKGYKNIGFFSVNVGGYSRIEELIDFCYMKQAETHFSFNLVQIRDTCAVDIKNIWSAIESGLTNSVYIGIESFDEKTRERVNKKISDADLEAIFERLVRNNIHIKLFLIYGLPGDDHSKWLEWVGKLSAMRKATKYWKPRIEFSMTNFEPPRGTPLENAPPVNFQEKDKFLVDWASALYEGGFTKYPLTLGLARGRFGRGENVYNMFLTLKREKPKDFSKIYTLFAKGLNTVSQTSCKKLARCY